MDDSEAPQDEPKVVTHREIVATGIRRLRAGLGIDQAALAERMTALGQPWHRQTVGKVESGARRITVDELLHLALALECSIPDVIAPAYPAHAGALVEVDDKQRRYITAADLDDIVGSGVPSLVMAWDGTTPVFPPRAWVSGEVGRRFGTQRKVMRGLAGSHAISPEEFAANVRSQIADLVAADVSLAPLAEALRSDGELNRLALEAARRELGEEIEGEGR